MEFEDVTSRRVERDVKGLVAKNMEGKSSKGFDLKPNRSIKEVLVCKSGGKSYGKGENESSVLSGRNQSLFSVKTS